MKIDKIMFLYKIFRFGAIHGFFNLGPKWTGGEAPVHSGKNYLSLPGIMRFRVTVI